MDPPDGEVGDVHELLLVRSPLQGAGDASRAAGHLVPAEEDRVGVPATVQRVLLPNLHGVVGQEVQDYEGPALVLRQAQVVDDGEEAADLAVPLHELLHVRVHVAAAQLHLAVEPLVSAGDAHRAPLQHLLPGRHEGVLLRSVGWRLVQALGRVVGAAPAVAVEEADAPAVDVQEAAHRQVLPAEVAARGPRKAVPSDELALRDAAVVLLPLDDLRGVVL
mmetsp:Transcript_138199/g.429604  ORF Transcript_138199/g.429604 Transcript_138199/m.429604 type:complete len:220 (-) Transcript_138199:447-1106(-)